MVVSCRFQDIIVILVYVSLLGLMVLTMLVAPRLEFMPPSLTLRCPVQSTLSIAVPLLALSLSGTLLLQMLREWLQEG